MINRLNITEHHPTSGQHSEQNLVFSYLSTIYATDRAYPVGPSY